jgi:hypothetical protein
VNPTHINSKYENYVQSGGGGGGGDGWPRYPGRPGFPVEKWRAFIPDQEERVQLLI